MTEWVLVITVAAGAWGNVAGSSHTFRDEAACYKALNSMRVTDNGKFVQGERGTVTIARCVPKEVKK